MADIIVVAAIAAATGQDHGATVICAVGPLMLPEIQFEGELDNSLLVVQKFLDCGLPEAITVTNNLARARVEQLEYLIARVEFCPGRPERAGMN